MERPMNDYGLMIICRRDFEEEWDTISNPSLLDLKRAYEFMYNEADDYLERKNCGIIYRFIRKRDLSKYKLAP